MGKVATGFSTSLDGFIARPEGEVGPLFDWYFSGDTEYKVPSGGITLKVSPQSADLLRESHRTIGALVVGRRHFDHAGGWGGRHPMDLPVFVLTHSVPHEWVYEGSPFTFVTDGVESAAERATEAAGDKGVGVGGRQRCAAEHQGRAHRRDRHRPGARPARGWHPVFRQPGRCADRTGAHPRIGGTWGDAPPVSRREVERGEEEVGTLVPRRSQA
jgi:dihydrofolate reductase